MPQLREGWCDRNTEETCLAYESNINNTHTAYQFEPLSRICLLQIFFNPGNEVVFERSLDELMEDVRRDQLMDISSREVVCEGLFNGECKSYVHQYYTFRSRRPTTISPTMPYVCQSTPSSKDLTAFSVCSRLRMTRGRSGLSESRFFLLAVQLDRAIRVVAKN